MAELRGQFHKQFCAPTPNFHALRPTFEKLFTGAKVRRKAQKMGAGLALILKYMLFLLLCYVTDKVYVTMLCY